MRDYDIKQVINILESDPNISLSKHSMDRWFLRDIDLDHVKECLNTLPVAIIKQNYNLFKLLYPHKSRKTFDIAIIIHIDDFENLKIVTIMISKQSCRIR